MNIQLYARAGEFFGRLKHELGCVGHSSDENTGQQSGGDLTMREESFGFVYQWTIKVRDRRMGYSVAISRQDLDLYRGDADDMAKYWAERIKRELHTAPDNQNCIIHEWDVARRICLRCGISKRDADARKER